MDVLALITARGGSKGLHRKNVLPLAGKPLISWTISAALKSGRLSRIVVSTDDEEIAQVAQESGAEVPFMRPPELAQDDSDHFAVVEHAIHWLGEDEVYPDYIMLLQPTSPLRTAGDINAAIQIAKERDAAAVVSVCVTKHHPYLSKQVLKDGTLADFVSDDVGDLSRQLLPPAYALNGSIYLNSRESLLSDRTFRPQGAYAYIMPPERSLDIDTPWDFHLAGLILNDKGDRRSA